MRQSTPRKAAVRIKVQAKQNSVAPLREKPANVRPPTVPVEQSARPPRAPRPNTARNGAPARAPRNRSLQLKGPTLPSVILRNHKAFLTDLEEQEIGGYKEVYYLRSRVPNDKKVNAILPERFQFVTNEHIAYRYQMLKVVGKGAFGGVIKCIDHKTGRQVAIKFLRDNAKHHEQIMYENQYMTKLQKGGAANNIIQLVETFTYHGFFCFVMELGCQDVYMTLKARSFEGFPLRVVQSVARQTAHALRFMHSQGVLHCDIKPENILFMSRRQNAVKLIDFGCSSDSGDLVYTYIQSRFYRAPEIVLGLDYGPEIDVWSLGCVLCEMVTGRALFNADDEEELMRMYMRVIGLPPKWMITKGKRSEYYFDSNNKPIVDKTATWADWMPGSSSLQDQVGVAPGLFLDFICNCLTWEPTDRLTPAAMLDHPWMRQAFPEPPKAVPLSARA